MTRKDYVRAAHLVNTRVKLSTGLGELYLLIGMAQDLANWFAEDNERFDRKRFYVACGLQDHLTGE